MMRILLVEEQPLFQEVLTALLTTRFGQVEVNSVASVEPAIENLRSARADLVLVDFSSGDVCGRPGFEGIVQSALPGQVIALDARIIGSHARRAKAAGAKGYIPKTFTRDLIDAAIGLVTAGGEYFPQVDASTQSAHEGARAALSPRQAEVLDLMLNGSTNAEIAQALGISVATVKLHVHAILKATGARNRTEVVLIGRNRAG